jgi:hypothetical protein
MFGIDAQKFTGALGVAQPFCANFFSMSSSSTTVTATLLIMESCAEVTLLNPPRSATCRSIKSRILRTQAERSSTLRPTSRVPFVTADLALVLRSVSRARALSWRRDSFMAWENRAKLCPKEGISAVGPGGYKSFRS